MRTVDPAQWSKRVVKPAIDVARPWRYRVEVMSGFERRLRRSFRDAMAELLRNCSMEGVSSIVDKRNPRPIRWCYCVFLLSAVAGCALVTCSDLAGMSGWPRAVAVLQAAPHPVQLVDFPAVALCSYNTVSAAALDSYANYLYSLEKNNTYSMESLKRNLIAFSGLITASSQVSFDSNFTKFLAEVARETNVSNIIYKLSPKCESMLVRCSWRGRRTHCDNLFVMRITDVGYCCVFNARYSLEDRHNLPFRVNMVGQDYGLSVVVKENTDDFTYVRRTGEEIEMSLFDGTQYPLVRAGVVRTFPVQRNASVFVTLRAAAQRAAHSLRFYTEAWRGCVMSYADGRPGHSWVRCVAECRMRAVRALCRCTPYTKPLRNHTDIGNQVTCSLEHLACLEKHKEKLTYFYPGDNAHESLSEEREDSVECLHCRPNCARLRYAARVWHVPYGNHINKMFANNFVEGVQLANATVLRVYFTAEDQRLHLVEPYMRFYEHICFLSSQWVFLVGLTAATCAELIYHCTCRHVLGAHLPLHRPVAPPLQAAAATRT